MDGKQERVAKPREPDYIEAQIDELIETLKKAKQANSYKELDSQISKADELMKGLVTTMGVESTQMEWASEDENTGEST